MRTTHDIYIASRAVGPVLNASAISGEYLSAASFLGVAGMVMSSGYDALWYPVCYACGYLFLLLFIAGPLRRFGAYTIPDFAEGRFATEKFFAQLRTEKNHTAAFGNVLRGKPAAIAGVTRSVLWMRQKL